MSVGKPFSQPYGRPGAPILHLVDMRSLPAEDQASNATPIASSQTDHAM
jgi:hypothetical protein